MFNWLFARSQGGQFLVRIEDTDQTRYDATAEVELLEDLKWMGLTWDEGPEVGGEAGPYKQSQRLELYKKHAEELVQKGSAYYCFCTPERLTALKEKQQQEQQEQGKSASGYDRHCRNLAEADVQARLQAGEPYVIRLKVPLEGTTVFQDALRGPIEYQNEVLDDLILYKSNGFPSYHLANVVDDHHMGITHVLRGEEWIPSTPKHQLIYEAFGWNLPVFTHLPVILAAGGGKLSKRKGATSVTEYKDQGYLPETMTNFLALLGWNPGGDKELMSLKELTDLFTLDKVNPKSCAFDEKKLEWMNGQHFMQGEPKRFLPEVQAIYTSQGVDISLYPEVYWLGVIALLQERCKKMQDFYDLAHYFFTEPTEYEPKGVKKRFKKGVDRILRETASAMERLESFTEHDIDTCFGQLIEDLELPGIGAMIHPIRLAVSGTTVGPSLSPMLALLGQEVVVNRLKKALLFVEELHSEEG
jgi:glutamyl-tRNA synthetase